MTFRERERIRYKANGANSRSVRDKICSQCGSTRYIEKHHPDYSKPLETITLCRKCHRKIHEKDKEIIEDSTCPHCCSKKVSCSDEQPEKENYSIKMLCQSCGRIFHQQKVASSSDNKKQGAEQQ